MLRNLVRRLQNYNYRRTAIAMAAAKKLRRLHSNCKQTTLSVGIRYAITPAELQLQTDCTSNVSCKEIALAVSLLQIDYSIYFQPLWNCADRITTTNRLHLQCHTQKNCVGCIATANELHYQLAVAKQLCRKNRDY